MKSIQLLKYGKDQKVVINEVNRPKVDNNEVLLKVLTSGVNPVDNMIKNGELKVLFPYKFPITLGNEFVGEIVEVGSLVSNFKVGQRVYGRTKLSKVGTFSQFISVNENIISLVPQYLTDVQAATIPLAAVTVMQCIEKLNVSKGDSVFVSGGSGSFGAIAIPVLKYFGYKVITTGSSSNKQRVLNLGADEFIDYKTQSFETMLSDVDGVIDTVGGNELIKAFSILKPSGHLVSIKGTPNKEFALDHNISGVKKFIVGLLGSKLDKLARKQNKFYHFIFAKESGVQVEQVSKILSEINFVPEVEKVFDFVDANLALESVASKHSKGKKVLRFNDDN